MRVKLKTEIATPFARFRQFIYASLGAAAGLATITTIPQVIIGLQRGEDASIPLQTAFTNLGIDVVGVTGAFFLLKQELSNERAKNEVFADKEKKQSSQLSKEEINEREKLFSLLPVEIQVLFDIILNN